MVGTNFLLRGKKLKFKLYKQVLSPEEFLFIYVYTVPKQYR